MEAFQDMIDFEVAFSELSSDPDKNGKVKTMYDFCPKFYDIKRGEDVSFLSQYILCLSGL